MPQPLQISSASVALLILKINYRQLKYHIFTKDRQYSANLTNIKLLPNRVDLADVYHLARNTISSTPKS
ncbi:MAG: hypothetical protein RLZZ135_1959 [Cyanobacteriota bacterium]|jgi:hypothetical protein